MRLFPLFLLTVMLLHAGAEAAELILDPPSYTPNHVFLNVGGTNNDQSTVYEHTEYNVFATLANKLHLLTHNQETYDSAQELMESWVCGLGTPTFGWTASISSNFRVITTHVDGDPGFDYAPYITGFALDPFVRLPLIQLELNATSGYQPFTLAEVSSAGWDASLYDAIIVRSDSALLLAANYTGAATPGEIPEAFVGTQDILNIYPASGLHYLLLLPEDFAEWTDFTSEHAGLDPAEDDNSNGRSNFIDYASGQDPEAAGLLPVVALEGNTLTLRRRINGSDAAAVAEYSDNLSKWDPLEEGVHYTLTSNTVTGQMRTLVLELLPGAPSSRFFRQSFGF
ncbi:MAG: hypothetical protein ACSHX9_14970 [Luteolibacter sp.]